MLSNKDVNKRWQRLDRTMPRALLIPGIAPEVHMEIQILAAKRGELKQEVAAEALSRGVYALKMEDQGKRPIWVSAQMVSELQDYCSGSVYIDGVAEGLLITAMEIAKREKNF